MSDNSLNYWDEVRISAAKIAVEILKQQHQPRDGAAYIVSKNSRIHRTTEGILSQVTIKLAAQKLVDGSHELATDEQIATYLEEQRRLRDEMRVVASKNVILFDGGSK